MDAAPNARTPASTLTITVVVGNPRIGSRTRLAADAMAEGLAALAQATGRASVIQTIELAPLAGEVFAFPSAAVDAAVAQTQASDVLVVASPTYKASYTGLLKAFFDRFSAGSLAGVVAVPLMLGGVATHALAVDTHLHPLLLEIGASLPTRGLFVLESELDALPATVAAWSSANTLILTRLLRPAS
jgi:FMN reductase